MSDIYDNDVAEQRIETPELVNDKVLPDQFKTVLGKMVKLMGKPLHDALALITYGTSKLQGNVVVNNAIQDVEALLRISENLYEDGFLENEALEKCDSIILPIDGMVISDSLKGVIIDHDLRSYTNGIEWLFNPDDEVLHNTGSVENVLRSLLGLVKTMKHLRDKRFVFSQIDGHNFFFNPEYGEFQFMFDGVDITQTDDLGDSYDDEFSDAMTCLLMYLLTGTNVNKNADTMVRLSALNGDCDDEGLIWDQEADTLSGTHSALSAWNSLPERIRNALFEAVFEEKKRRIPLDEWETLLGECLTDIEVCAFCGHNVFKTAKQCICCGNTTEKADLLTKWLIESNSQPQYLRIAFGRGTTLPGELLGIHSKQFDFMKLMYNPKTNALGLKNLSNISWFIAGNGNQKEIIPGKVVLIANDLEITFDSYPGVSAKFVGYEIK